MVSFLLGNVPEKIWGYSVTNPPPHLTPELDGEEANSNFMLSMFGSEMALST